MSKLIPWKGDKWNVLLAHGGFSDATDPNKIDYHGPSSQGGNAISSPDQIDIYDGMTPVFINKGDTPKQPISLTKVHAILMFLAWGLFAPIGYVFFLWWPSESQTEGLSDLRTSADLDQFKYNCLCHDQNSF